MSRVNEDLEDSEQEEDTPPVEPIKPKAKAKPPVLETVEHPPLIFPDGITWDHYYTKAWGHMVVPKKRSGSCLDGESTELSASFLDYSLERARGTFDLIGRIDITMLSLESGKFGEQMACGQTCVHRAVSHVSEKAQR